MNLLPELAAGEPRDHLVDVHVGAGAGARLHHPERKLVGMAAGRDFERSGGDRRRERLRQLAEFAVRLGGGPLDERDGADQLGRHAVTADPEIVEGTLRLGAPKRVRGDANFAEAVLFDAVVGAHG